MRLKTILCATAACMMTAMTSCSSEEDVKVPVNPGTIDLSNCESVPVAVGLPSDGMKTRAGQTSTFTYGSDGLLSFSRTIDHLWYAIYHNGTLIYHSMQPGVPQAHYDADTQSFSLDIQIPRINEQINLNEYSVFFMAGNALDKVETREITDGIGLDFANKTMYAYPGVINRTVAAGNMYNPEQTDFFVKYTTLDRIVAAGTKGNITLIRPFCQVSLLTDELCQPNIINAYSSNGQVAVTSIPYIAAQKAASTVNTLAYGWNYGRDEILTKDASEFGFALNANAFDNSTNAYTIPQEVTFKSRKMFCVSTFLMLAPSTKKQYDATAIKTRFGFNLNVTGNTAGTSTTAAADMPASSLRANEKYVIYNKLYDDGEGEGGGGGLFSTHYAIDIVTDPNWFGNNDTEY